MALGHSRTSSRLKTKHLITLFCLFSLLFAGTWAQFTKLTNSTLGKTYPSVPEGFTEFRGKMVFSADDGFFGKELWISDGTDQGTQLVKDVYPGPSSSYPNNLIVYQDKLYFSAIGKDTGRELWVYDGSSVSLVKDIKSGGSDSNPAGLFVVRNRLVFVADDGEHGIELWSYDGNQASLVLDILPGSDSGFPSALSVVQDLLFFTATTSQGVALFTSDGTTQGTNQIYFFGNFGVGSWTEFQGKYWFTHYTQETGFELWSSAGTSQTTQLFMDILPGPDSSDPNSLTSLKIGQQEILFFGAQSPNNLGLEVWRSDGTQQGTFLVKDINPGSGWSSPSRFTQINDIVVFSAYDGEGTYLWRTDSTPQGTVRVEKISFETTIGSEINDKIIFVGRFNPENVNNYNSKLYSTDGYTVSFFKEIYPGPSGEFVYASSKIIKLGNQDTIFFSAYDDVHSTELWITQGTPESTRLVKDINQIDLVLTNILGYIRRTQVLLFATDSNEYGRELWKTDGINVELVKDIYPGNSSSLSFYSSSIVFKNSNLFFSADDGVHGTELWKSNGNPEDTVMVKDIHPGSNSSFIYDFEAGRNILYFLVGLGVKYGATLYRTDGTEQGTFALSNVVTYSYSHVALDDTLFFPFYSDSGVGQELYKTDGTTISLVKDINQGENGSNPSSLTKLKSSNIIFFSAYTEETGAELWKTDGTEEGTVLVKDIIPGPDSSTPTSFTPVEERVFFWVTIYNSNTNSNDLYLYVSDGTPEGTNLVKSFLNSNGYPTLGVDVNGLFVFGFNTENTGLELWSSDGTEQGTQLVKDIYPGPASSNPLLQQSGVAYHQILFFAADNGVNGRELWRTNGKNDGTLFVGDLAPGLFSSEPLDLNFIKSQREFNNGVPALFFTALSGTNGRQLYKYEPTSHTCSSGAQCGENQMCCDDVVDGPVCYDPRCYSCVEMKKVCHKGDQLCTGPNENDVKCYDPNTQMCTLEGEVVLKSI